MLEVVRNIYNLIFWLRIKTKAMPEADFNSLIQDKALDTQQKIYLICFRYC